MGLLGAIGALFVGGRLIKDAADNAEVKEEARKNGSTFYASNNGGLRDMKTGHKVHLDMMNRCTKDLKTGEIIEWWDK